MAFGFMNSYSDNRQNQAAPQGQRQQMPRGWGQQQRGQQPSGARQQTPQQPPSARQQLPRQQQRQTPGQQPQQAQPQQMQGQQQRQMPGQQQPNPKQNAPLPDGVRYEPLDQRTLEQIQKVAPNFAGLSAAPSSAGNIPQEPVNVPHVTENITPVFAPALPVFDEQHISDKLRQFMQNERNGSIYYKNLATVALKPAQRRVLNEISESCKERGAAYNAAYHGYKNEDYEPAEAEILNVSSFHDGVHLAIEEESYAIRELIALYEKITDDSLSRTLNSQIHRKASDVNLLRLMYK